MRSYLACIHIEEQRVFTSFINKAVKDIYLWANSAFDKCVTNILPWLSRMWGLESGCILKCHSGIVCNIFF